LKRHGEDAEGEGEERECPDYSNGSKVHPSDGAKKRARLGGAHNQPPSRAVWNFDPELSPFTPSDLPGPSRRQAPCIESALRTGSL
jgi:hypothetical protein